MGSLQKITTASLCFLIVNLMSPAGWAADRKSGQFHFSTSCAPDVQDDFSNGVRLLHSFGYLETTKIFAAIITKDPTCAMAYWGAAMSIWHPLWAPPSPADLAAGAAVLTQAKDLKTTVREAAYITALSGFFSSTDQATHRQRAAAYAVNMNALHEKYGGEDVEATVFYALSLLASADPRDKTYKNQHKSGDLLASVKQSHPRHPGILHYRIHAYDYPGLAHLALEDAKKYAAAARDSAHAQHMPSHIFTRLGLWNLSLASNHDSIKSAADYTIKAQLKTHYDEGLHSMDYLMYALLQTGRDKAARILLDKLAVINGPENFKSAFTYATSTARYSLERRAWKEASRIELVVKDFPWQNFPMAEAIHYFARGIGAARSGGINQAQAEVAVLTRLQKELPPSAPLYWRVEVQVQVDAVTAWILLKQGQTKEALALAAAAADREDAVDKHPVTPGEVVPARELYGDMLLEVGLYQAALRQYQQVLTGSPYRLNALRGASVAAKKTGLVSLSRDYWAVIQAQIKFGDRQMPEIW